MEGHSERNTRWPPRLDLTDLERRPGKQHLRRSSSASSGLFNLPLLGSSSVAKLLLWTSLILGLMVSLSFLFPIR